MKIDNYRNLKQLKTVYAEATIQMHLKNIRYISDKSLYKKIQLIIAKNIIALFLSVKNILQSFSRKTVATCMNFTHNTTSLEILRILCLKINKYKLETKYIQLKKNIRLI